MGGYALSRRAERSHDVHSPLRQYLYILIYRLSYWKPFRSGERETTAVWFIPTQNHFPFFSLWCQNCSNSIIVRVSDLSHRHLRLFLELLPWDETPARMSRAKWTSCHACYPRYSMQCTWSKGAKLKRFLWRERLVAMRTTDFLKKSSSWLPFRGFLHSFIHRTDIFIFKYPCDWSFFSFISSSPDIQGIFPEEISQAHTYPGEVNFALKETLRQPWVVYQESKWGRRYRSSGSAVSDSLGDSDDVGEENNKEERKEGAEQRSHGYA